MTALKERESDEPDEEITRLKAKMGEITIDSELLREKIAALVAIRRNLVLQAFDDRLTMAGKPGKVAFTASRADSPATRDDYRAHA